MSSHEPARPWRPEDATPTVPAIAPTVAVGAPTVAVAPAEAAAPAAPATVAMSSPGELLRFGPGVPVPAAVPDMSQATAVWRGDATQPTDVDGTDKRRRRRRLTTWLLPLLVLIAVLAILLWQRSGSALTVTDATVRTASPSLTCGQTATVTATMHTNGGAGTITYQWRRSDGTVSDTLRQQVSKGSTNVPVVLLWSFHGQGSINATATLEVLSPSALSASTTFAYSCSS